MLWFDKEELDYYHPNTDGRCYCELLVQPNDLTVQLRFPAGTPLIDVITIQACTADGNTAILNLDDGVYATFIYALDKFGGYYITMRLETFADILCDGYLDNEKCFVVRMIGYATTAGTTVKVFEKYTQKYCIADCCFVNGQLTAGSGQNKKVYIDDAVNLTDATHCGNPLVRIESKYDCIDALGYYYGTPKTIKQLPPDMPAITHIPFQQITNLQGLFKPNPAEITVNISRNCRTQKTERANEWMMQGSDFFPAWKMRDLENQFSANFILVNLNEYKFNGGRIAEKIKNYQKDYRADFYRLETTMQECRIWTIFGCGDECSNLPNTQKVVVIEADIPIYKFFDENGTPIANNVNDWFVYLSSMNEVESVTDVSYLYYTYGYAYAFLIESNGYIPPFFYINQVGAVNKIFTVDEVVDLSNSCTPAAFGTLTDVSANCAPAPFGTISDIANSENIYDVYSQQYWEVQTGGQVAVSDNLARLDFVSHNPNYGTTQPSPITIDGEIIGWVPSGACPSITRTIRENLPTGVVIQIDTSGQIRWFGEIQQQVMYGYVEVINVYYNI